MSVQVLARPIALTTSLVARTPRQSVGIPTAIVIGAFSIAAIPWMGSSYIALNFPISLSPRFALRVPIVQPASPSFCLAVSWTDDDGILQRRKLWNNVGEQLSYDVYAGELIDDNTCTIEVWSVESTNTIVNSADLILYTTLIRGFNATDESGYDSYTPTGVLT